MPAKQAIVASSGWLVPLRRHRKTELDIRWLSSHGNLNARPALARTAGILAQGLIDRVSGIL